MEMCASDVGRWLPRISLSDPGYLAKTGQRMESPSVWNIDQGELEPTTSPSIDALYINTCQDVLYILSHHGKRICTVLRKAGI